MYQASISLNSQLGIDNGTSHVIVHGSIITKSEGAEINIKRLANANFKSRTLSIEIDINDSNSFYGTFVKPFLFIEKVGENEEFDQVELTSNQDHHVVIDIADPEEVYNDFSVERDLRQSISTAENKLSKIGSVVLMSKGGSKLKDNK